MTDERQLPTVSVVMCTYNGEAFIREQLDTILAQDYPLHEIIVQDDGSTDATLDILDEYARRHDFIRIVRNAERLGFNRNFHTAMLRATGQFIAIADQDDIWFPQKLRRQVETIGDHDVCISDYFTDPEYRLPLHVRVSPKTTFEYTLFYDGTPGHSMLLRADFVRGIETWDYAIYYDWWLAIHAHMGRGLVKVDEPLNWHRHHVASATTRILRRGPYEPVAHPTWQPYVLGLRHRLHLQRKGNWQRFYTYIHRATAANARLARIHTMSGLMVRRDPWSLLRLCCLCCRYADLTYIRPARGLKGRVRGFFYPLISAYGCDLFKLEP